MTAEPQLERSVLENKSATSSTPSPKHGVEDDDAHEESDIIDQILHATGVGAPSDASSDSSAAPRRPRPRLAGTPARTSNPTMVTKRVTGPRRRSHGESVPETNGHEPARPDDRRVRRSDEATTDSRPRPTASGETERNGASARAPRSTTRATAVAATKAAHRSPATAREPAAPQNAGQQPGQQQPGQRQGKSTPATDGDAAAGAASAARARAPGRDRVRSSYRRARRGRGLLDLRDEGYGLALRRLPPSTRSLRLDQPGSALRTAQGDYVEGACRPASNNEKYRPVRIDTVSNLDPRPLASAPGSRTDAAVPDSKLVLETQATRTRATSRPDRGLLRHRQGPARLIVSRRRPARPRGQADRHSIEANNPKCT